MIMKWIFGTSAVVGVVTLALGFMLVFTGSPATENPDDTRKLASALVTDENGTSEDIQVHGNWVIEVHDPDGTMVEKHEFENEMSGTGRAITEILAREKRPGNWLIRLARIEGFLTIREPTEPDVAVFVSTDYPSKTLTVSSGSDGKLILQGEVTVPEAMNSSEPSSNPIRMVGTQVYLCDSQTTSIDCLTNYPIDGNDAYQNGLGITIKHLEPHIDVKVGQKIIVTVEIGFS